MDSVSILRTLLSCLGPRRRISLTPFTADFLLLDLVPVAVLLNALYSTVEVNTKYSYSEC